MMNNYKPYEDRYDAGEQLANALERYAHRDDVVILGLPRGGVPVAYEVAIGLNAPLDVFVVRKLGVPTHEELAMGAIATGGVRVLNNELIRSLNISEASIENVTNKEQRELERREALYRDGYPMPKLHHKTVILVDDGLATGATMQAAVQALNQLDPAGIVVAVPTASRETCETFREMNKVDDVICVLTPREFRAVGLWYERFDQTSDDEVRRLLKQAREREHV